MMDIMCIIIVLIIFLFVVVVMASYISKDIKSYREYLKATPTRGVVIKPLDDVYVAAYGNVMLITRTRRYHQYEVYFEAGNGRYTGITQTKHKNLKHGDSLLIKYLRDSQTGEVRLATRMFYDRLNELIIGTILGIIFALIIIFFIV